MSHELIHKVWAVSSLIDPAGVNGGPVDLNATGDKFILTPASPIDIYRFGYILNSTQDPDAGGFVMALDKRITAGSDTGRTEEATITRADAETGVAGQVIYNDVVKAVAETSSAGLGDTLQKVNVGPAGPLRINQGEQAVLEVTNANGAAATAWLFIEYAQLPFDKSDATLETA